MMTADTSDAMRKFSTLRQQLSEAEIAKATRIALNDTTRKGKAEVSRAIRRFYNIKAGRINDSNPRKGVSIQFASNNNLTAKIKTGHIPVNLSGFNGLRLSKKNGLSLEVVKGKRRVIPSAFRLFATKGTKGATSEALDSSSKAIAFARGKFGKPRFNFGKPRKPIAPLTTLSVATAARNTKAVERYEPEINTFLEVAMLKQLERQVELATQS